MAGKEGRDSIIRRASCVMRSAKRNTQYAIHNTQYGFTLIELIIVISISVMISAALYLSLRSALDSWQVSQDQLLLQEVSSRLMEELIEGLPDSYGLRDALEVVDGDNQQISVVMPWTDDTHNVYSGIYTYTLNQHIKPGTPIPIAEALFPESKEYRVVPVALVDQGKSDAHPEVRIKIDVPAGSRLRFTFHPDYQKDVRILTTLRYDGFKKALFIDDHETFRELSQNTFGVNITDFLIRYFDNTNTEIGKDGFISPEDIPTITGLELAFKAKSKQGNVRETVSFVSLRNAPMRSGNLTLREASRIPIPNSKEIKAFFLTNLSGIENNDTLILEARSQASRKIWRLLVQFSKSAGLSEPLIESYSIEYPAGDKVYSERPRTSVEAGLNLLNLSPNGLYDYDDDQMQDRVILEGKVILEVKKMDITGASIFVKP